MPDAIAAALALFAYGAAAGKARAVRRQPGARAPRALLLTLLALAGGWTFLVKPVATLVDSWTGVELLSRLLADALALCTGCGTQAMLLYLTHDQDTGRRLMRPRIAALGIAVTAMSTAFFVSRPADVTGSFAVDHGATGFYLAFTVPYLAYLAYIFVGITRVCWRYAEDAPASLRLGLRLIAAGGTAGLLYVALRAGYTAIAQVTQSTEHGAAYSRLSDLTVAVVTLLVVIGATLPSWAARVAVYRDVRQLYPLWRAMLRVFPDLAVLPAGSAARDALPGKDLRRRRTRRVIELRDGALELRGRFRPAVAAHALRKGKAAGLDGEELEATVQASRIAVALHEQEHALDADQQVERIAAHGGGRDVGAEVAWLRRVSTAFTRSPVVADVLDKQSATVGLPPPKRPRSQRVAQLVTEITAPAPMLVALLLLAGAASGRTVLSGVGWGLLAALFFAIAPFAGIMWGVLQGRLTDHHVTERAQRPVVMALSLVSFVAGLTVMVRAHAPDQLVSVMVALLAAALVSLLVTLTWKVSMHMAVAGCAAALLTMILGTPALAGWPLLGVMAWSRVRLGDHTPGQALAGTVLGAVIAGGVFTLIA